MNKSLSKVVKSTISGLDRFIEVATHQDWWWYLLVFWLVYITTHDIVTRDYFGLGMIVLGFVIGIIIRKTR